MLGDAGDAELCADPGEVGDVGWNVGLCEGAWRGFLGSNEIGGECKTSDCR